MLLPDPTQVIDCVSEEEGLLHSISPGAVIVDPSTIDPETTEAMVVRAEKIESRVSWCTGITALMAPYYSHLETVVSWGQREGVNQKQAADCASVMYRKIEDANLNALIQESMTPYGLNEMAMKTINANGGFNPWKLALAAVKQKIESDWRLLKESTI